MMCMQSQKKISRIELILQLLEEEKKEQSMGTADDDHEHPPVKPAGVGVPIHKISETETPDGSGIDEPKLDKPAGGIVPICKMSETETPDGSGVDEPKLDKPTGVPIHNMSDKAPKPPDGMAVDNSLPNTSKPAGGSIHKIQGNQETSSEQMDGKGSTSKGTESNPKKPPLHHKLTVLFSMKAHISEDKENSGK